MTVSMSLKCACDLSSYLGQESRVVDDAISREKSVAYFRNRS